MKTKLDHAAPAQDLYISTLFRGRRAFVEDSCDRWFILSAKHGLVGPGQVLEPYDQTLDDASPKERRAWSEGVLGEVDARLGSVVGAVFEVHAGAPYRNFGLLQGLQERGAEIDVPAEGLNLFEQQAFYAAGKRDSHAPNRQESKRVAVTGAEPGGRQGAYARLAVHLAGATAPVVRISFPEVERLLGRALPASARNHRAWWANDPSHSHARAWMGAGWRVSSVNQAAEWVEFAHGASA